MSPALGRTTRSHQNVNSHDSGDAVTVVSTVSEQSALAPGKNWLKNAPRKTSLDSQKYIVESRSSMNETASHLSVCTAPSPQAAQRVSLSPLNASVKLTLPEFKGTDREKLRACLDSLKTASHANRPTFSNSKTSKFASNIRTVSSFLFAVIDSNGEYGGEDGDPAALYVCGAPGLGKTSGVTWCCDNAIASCKANTPEPKICHINAACLASEPNPLQYLLNELGEVVGIKARNPTTATIFRMLQRVKGKPKRTQVILVVDEIDALVSNNDGLSSKEVLLRTILEWVNNPDMQMALIGISNCINDDNTSRILEAGSVRYNV